MPDFTFEDQHPAPIAGIDEAGRGPWAGPVVAAAVILDPADLPDGLDDSKRLTARRRDALFGQIVARAHVGIGTGTVEEIDRLNVLRANDLAMARALAALPVRPAFALIDGKWLPPDLGLPARAVIGGDALSLSIAAASIIAKVTRDRIMAELAAEHPGYGWERNAGYGTAQHREALKTLGVTPHHRRSFRPIHNILV
jgi:ribonuclease HII